MANITADEKLYVVDTWIGFFVIMKVTPNSGSFMDAIWSRILYCFENNEAINFLQYLLQYIHIK